jgi:hypothetical protein
MTFINEGENVFFIAFFNFHDQQTEERDKYELFLYLHQSSFFASPSLGAVCVKTSIRVRIILQMEVMFFYALMNSLTVDSLAGYEMHKLKYKQILNVYLIKTFCLNK